LLQVANT